jgi:hypothetical protein
MRDFLDIRLLMHRPVTPHLKDGGRNPNAAGEGSRPDFGRALLNLPWKVRFQIVRNQHNLW